jgi:hypothetical protein
VQSNGKAAVPGNAIDKGCKYVDERPVSANKSTLLCPSVKKRFFNGDNCLSVGETGLLIDCY